MHKRNVLLFGISFLSIISILNYSQKLEASVGSTPMKIPWADVQQDRSTRSVGGSENRVSRSIPENSAIQYKPNEAGKVIIVMFHKFVDLSFPKFLKYKYNTCFV